MNRDSRKSLLQQDVVVCWDQKNQESKRRDKILPFLFENRANLSTFGGDFLTSLHRTLERKENPLEKVQKSSGENFPKLHISVPCRGRMCPESVMTFTFKHLVFDC